MYRSLILLALFLPAVATAASPMPATPPVAQERVTHAGMQGEDVRILQEELVAVLGTATAFTPTGYFGSKTEAAVKRFQTQEGIVRSGTPRTTGYGQVGPTTRMYVRAARLAQLCTDNAKPSRQACLELYYAAYGKDHGTAQALRLINAQIAREQYFGVTCHAVMHEIGHSGAREYGTLGTAFLHGGDKCQNGYYHGVVEELLGNRAIASVTPEELRSFCATAGQYASSSLPTQNCVHGIGHALVYMTKGNLPQSLMRCGDMATDEYRMQCAAGSYMQHWFADELHGLREGTAFDLSNACINTHGDQETCWLTESAKEIAGSAYGMNTAEHYCGILETTPHQQDCLLGLAGMKGTTTPVTP